MKFKIDTEDDPAGILAAIEFGFYDELKALDVKSQEITCPAKRAKR
jgi:hypothetical protein